jgi:hypothetical protein
MACEYFPVKREAVHIRAQMKKRRKLIRQGKAPPLTQLERSAVIYRFINPSPQNFVSSYRPTSLSSVPVPGGSTRPLPGRVMRRNATDLHKVTAVVDEVEMERRQGSALGGMNKKRTRRRKSPSADESEEEEDIYQDGPPPEEGGGEPEPPPGPEPNPDPPPDQGPDNPFAADGQNAQIAEDLNDGVSMKDVVAKYGPKPVKSLLDSIKNYMPSPESLKPGTGTVAAGAWATEKAADAYIWIKKQEWTLKAEFLKVASHYGPQLVMSVAPVVGGIMMQAAHGIAGGIGGAPPPNYFGGGGAPAVPMMDGGMGVMGGGGGGQYMLSRLGDSAGLADRIMLP